MEETLQEQEQSNLFDDHVEHTMATQGQRFLNWLIDNLFMRFALSLATGYLLGYILMALAPEFLTKVAYEIDGEKTWRFWLLSFLLGYFNYIVYYTICEKGFKGYTLGKLITGTRAIRMDGQELTLKDAFLRSLSRMVPFEAFSGFSEQPWHDKWTKTTVIKAR
jgi:uncharacterized RDD family membrane protein YckC